jgi:hypothetical protein
MYGTVARLQVQLGKMSELREIVKEYDALAIPGHQFAHLYEADGSPDEAWMAVGFSDREAYRRNADDSAQHARYMKMRAVLAADPDWHDGSITHSF